MKQEKRFIVDILFVLALFGVFAVSALVLVTIGANVYENTIQEMHSNYDNRIATAYITEKVRRSDSYISCDNQSIQIGFLENEPAIILTENIEDEFYSTYLYLHNGWLKELCVREENFLGGNMLEAGQNILELSELHFEQTSDNIIKISLTTPDGKTNDLFLSTKCQSY